MGINIQEIKEYNEKLKKARELVSKSQAEIEFNDKEVAKLCAELSAEIGMEVTPENVNQLYVDRTSKIQETLSIGNDILSRVNQANSIGAVGMGAGVGAVGTGGAGVTGMNVNAGYANVNAGYAQVGQVAQQEQVVNTGYAQVGQVAQQEQVVHNGYAQVGEPAKPVYAGYANMNNSFDTLGETPVVQTTYNENGSTVLPQMFNRGTTARTTEI